MFAQFPYCADRGVEVAGEEEEELCGVGVAVCEVAVGVFDFLAGGEAGDEVCEAVGVY